MKEKTLASVIHYEGVGLHSGKPVQMALKPADSGTGIIFRRTDLPNKGSVRAHVANVTNTLRATTLENGEVMVATVEHVLSALQGLGIDHCEIELSSPEPPVGDGSAATFVELIEKAGIKDLPTEKKYLDIRSSCAVYDFENDRFIVALPYDGLRITFISENSHPLLGTMVCDVEINPENYRTEIMRARTIGFLKELEELRAMGLARGGTLENAIVYSETECLSKPRFADELVRHKVLDLVGDISLAGNVRAHLIARKSSHGLNTELAARIVAQAKEEEIR